MDAWTQDANEALAEVGAPVYTPSTYALELVVAADRDEWNVSSVTFCVRADGGEARLLAAPVGFNFPSLAELAALVVATVGETTDPADIARALVARQSKALDVATAGVLRPPTSEVDADAAAEATATALRAAIGPNRGASGKRRLFALARWLADAVARPGAWCAHCGLAVQAQAPRCERLLCRYVELHCAEPQVRPLLATAARAAGLALMCRLAWAAWNAPKTRPLDPASPPLPPVDALEDAVRAIEGFLRDGVTAWPTEGDLRARLGARVHRAMWEVSCFVRVRLEREDAPGVPNGEASYAVVPKPAPRDDRRTVFHGSPAYNWVSILRHGMRSMSGTAHMSTGAAYGKGVYSASDVAVACGYAKGGGGLHVVAECSVPRSVQEEPRSKFTVVQDASLIRVERLHTF